MASRPFFLLALLGLAAPAAAAIQVTTTSGARDLPEFCSLRDALVAFRTMQPVADCPAGSFDDIIELPANATITLVEKDADSIGAGLPAIPDGRGVTIVGNGATIRRSNGTPCNRDGVRQGGEFRFFEASGRLRLENLRLVGGCADGTSNGNGGAIEQFGSRDLATFRLDLQRVTLEGNVARDDGGAIALVGVRGRIVDSTLSGNLANRGGAIANGGTLFVERSLLKNNQIVAGTLPPAGSAAMNLRSLTFTNSTVVANYDFNETLGGTLAMLDGLDQPAYNSLLTLVFTTVAYNVGYGIAIPFNESGDLRMRNSIVAYHSQLDCFRQGGGGLTYEGVNLFSDQSSCYVLNNPAHRANVDPRLFALADHGGATETMAIASDSPARDAAPDCTDGLFTVSSDQRGQIRPSGGACDVGAFELATLVFANGFE